MNRCGFLAFVLLQAALPAAADTGAQGCREFTWNTTRALTVMRAAPQLLAASADPEVNPIRLVPERHFAVTLLPQSSIAYVIPPPARHTHATGGLLFFRPPRAGVYRVALTSRHQVDMLDGHRLIPARARQHGHCAGLRNMIEFELPARREITMQLSGGESATVSVVVFADDP